MSVLAALDRRAEPLNAKLGKAAADRLAKGLDLTTVGELIDYFPRKYLERGELTSIAGMHEGEDVTIVAQVLSSSKRSMRKRKGWISTVLITDHIASPPDTIELTFFNSWAAQRDLTSGTIAVFSGTVSSYGGRLTMNNPNFVVLHDINDDGSDTIARAIPVYPATAKMSTWWIGDRIREVLASLGITEHSVNPAALPDPIPQDIRERDGLRDIAASYRDIHLPATPRDAYRARHRFRYQEALVLQTALARRRAENQALPAVARRPIEGGLLAAFDAALPFELTEGQRAVGARLADGVASDSPLNVLLQGDVGSGKTIVALRAMLQVIDAGGQAALLAPTEVLAAQHAQSIRKLLGPLAQGGMLGGATNGTKVALLTGSLPTAARREALLDAASGQAGIVVGTHALLGPNVQFADLGLVVVDEQHRFGVAQRDELRSRAQVPPHLLVMTATPIPRTVAMTAFGDLTTLTLEGLPDGRSPIATHIVALAETPGWWPRIWERAREEIDAGRQVYVVCPQIGPNADSANLDDFADPDDPLRNWSKAWSGDPEVRAIRAELQSAEEEAREKFTVERVAEMLADEPALAGVRMGILHGRLETTEKTRVMGEFDDGDLDLLISTTVIEVGVDVPAATLMVIMDVDRFGISQLHQLRGRVGRGEWPGTCLLVTRQDGGHPSRDRIKAVQASTDGFHLAVEDLRLRREGNILGANQSGRRSTLKLLRVSDDEKVIATARQDAQRIVDEDPALVEHPALAQAMEELVKPESEAWLDRG